MKARSFSGSLAKLSMTGSGRFASMMPALGPERPSTSGSPATSRAWDGGYRRAGGIESVTALSLSMVTFWLAVMPFAVARSVWGV
jgi:hypothetical protein